MEIINKIIFNQLASKKSIFLPGIGTIWVELCEARIHQDGKITPPYNKFNFSPGQDDCSESILVLLQQNPGYSPEQAHELWNKWIKENENSQRLVFAGTGEIRNNIFTPTERLNKLLNPEQKNTTTKMKAYSKTERTWIVLIVIFVLILGGGWTWWWYSGHGNNPNKPAKPGNEIVINTETVNHNEVQDNTDFITEPVHEKEAETPQQEATPQPTAPTPQEPVTQTEIQPAQKTGKYYVVGNVFSEPANADKYIREMKRDFPNLNFDFEKLPYKGRTMVTLFSSTNVNEVNARRNQISQQIVNYELWVYKN